MSQNSSQNITSDLEQEVKTIFHDIDACIGSTKDKMTVEDLQNDIIQITGKPIPFKKFGHGTLASFLQSYPKNVMVFNRGGKLYVDVVSSEKNEHIKKLVSGQKASKSKGSFTRPKNIRKPRTNSWAPPRSSRPRYGSIKRAPLLHMAEASGYRLRPPPPQAYWPYSGNYYNYYNKPARSSYNFNQNYYSTYYNFDNTKPAAASNYVNPSGNYNYSKPVSNSSNSKSANYATKKPEIKQPNITKPNRENIVKKVSPPSSTVHSTIETIDLTRPTTTVISIDLTRPTTPVISLYKSELQKELRLKSLPEVTFNTITTGKKNSFWISRFRIDDKTFSSYPAEMRSKKEAEELVAKKGLEYLQCAKDMQNKSSLPVTKDFGMATRRVIDLIRKSKGNVWWEYICDVYKKEYNETLQFSWVVWAKSQPDIDIKIDQPSTDLFILNIKSEVEKSKNDSSLPKLSLPEENQWQVFVTYFKDCSEFWFRFIGEYSDAYSDLLTEIELHFLEESNLIPIKNPVIGGYYACYQEDWFRVQVTDIQGDKATLFCIDHGDEEKVSLNKLYPLMPKFKKLPPQSICGSLAGFENGLTDLNMFARAHNWILGKTLIADVLARDQKFSVVLYDTSTDEDININERLLQMLPQAQSEFPPEHGICEVYLTHVNTKGDVFVKIESATYKILENLLVTARKRCTELLGEEVVSINLERLYLSKFSADGEWHRAAPRSAQSDSDDTVLLKAIDIGYVERVPLTNIVDIENFCEALCKIPPQILVCRLYNVPSNPQRHWTAKASERLHSLFPSKNVPFLMKVIRSKCGNEPTLVNLFQREPQNRLVSVNDTLDMEEDIFSARTEDSNNNVEDYHNLPDVSLSVSPESGSYFDVIVTYAVSPSHFAIRPYKKESRRKLEYLMGEMNAFYSDTSNLTHVKEIKIGGFYALQKVDLWYRVRIDQIMDQLVSGSYIDYGDSFFSTPDKIQPLWSNFRELPCQAFKAILRGISPKYGDWTPEDCIRFCRLTENQAFVSEVIDIIPANPDSTGRPTLNLTLIDVSNDDFDVFIDDIFIKEGRALKN